MLNADSLCLARILLIDMNVIKSTPMSVELASSEFCGLPPQLWVARCAFPSVTALALQQRWIHDGFARQGVRVATLQQTDDAQLRVQPVYHNLRGLFHEGGNVPALWACANGYANTAIVGMTWMDEYQALLVRPNEGMLGPGCLRGKRLGLSCALGNGIDVRRATALRGYSETLALGGVDIDEVHFVDIIKDEAAPDASRDCAQDAGVAALLAGRIDALYARGATARQLKRLYGLEVAFELSANKALRACADNATLRVLTVDREFLAEHSDIVVHYLAVLLQAARWAEAHAKETRRALSAYLNKDTTALVSAHGRHLHRSLRVQLLPKHLRALVEQKEFLLKWGFIAADVDVTEWIFPQPLLQAQQLLARGGAQLPEVVAA